MRLVFADGTSVHLGGDVAGASPFAESLRKALADEVDTVGSFEN